MPEGMTARHGLPLLFVGQSQKETTYNEALVRLDALLHPVVETALTAPPAPLNGPDDGKCWLIASPATGIWAGKEGQIARWSAGSWRYILPVPGMAVWMILGAKRLFYIAGAWQEPAAIADAVGGTVIDLEARSAIAAILNHLRQICDIPA